ncbi:MAG: hypothetical protein ACK5GZ_05655 [Cyanobium sp.]|jgi:hypothetical protein
MPLIIAAVARRRAQILKALGDLLGDRQWRQFKAHHPKEILAAWQLLRGPSTVMARDLLIECQKLA